MSRFFEASNSEYLSNETAPVSDAPLTMACWFRSGNVASRQCLMQICDASQANRWWGLELRGDVAGDPIHAVVVGTGSTQKLSTSGYSADTWHHACAKFTSSSLAVLLDGGSKASGSHNRNPTGGGGVDRTAIGMLRDATPSRPLDGRVAEAAVWDVSLSDAEIGRLAKGFSPFAVRPANLVRYWPLWGIHSPEEDWSGNGVGMIPAGTVDAAAHPPNVRYYRTWAMPLIETTGGGGPGAAVMAAYHFRRRRTG